LSVIISEEETDTTPIIDEESGEEIIVEPPAIRYPGFDLPHTGASEPGEKIYVNGVDVTVLVSRELYFDHTGKPITVSLKDYTKDIMNGHYKSLDDFGIAEQFRSKNHHEELQAGCFGMCNDRSNRIQCDLLDLMCHAGTNSHAHHKRKGNNVKKRKLLTSMGSKAGEY